MAGGPDGRIAYAYVMESTRPSDPGLATVADVLELYGWAGWIMDPDLNVIWISPEFKALAGPGIEQHYGRHFMEVTLSEENLALTTRRSLLRSGLDLLPWYLRFTPGGRERVREMIEALVGPGAGGVVDSVPDQPVGPVVGSSVKVVLTEGMAPTPANYLLVELHNDDGGLIGFMTLFVGTLPFRFIPLLARGDEAALERTIRLAKPGHRQAAILFADLQSSGILSSRLPSALYFGIIRELISTIDDVVTSHSGIVGRHAGDGVTAFFIAEALGSPSSSARATVQAARQIRDEVARIAERHEDETDGLVSPKDFLINMGLHWGNSLYMGQLVSSGRLEVTALGDAVNECARIQESANDGQLIASKQLLENLSSDDAVLVGIRPVAISYQRLAEMPGATQKAIRDAGGIPVVLL